MTKTVKPNGPMGRSLGEFLNYCKRILNPVKNRVNKNDSANSKQVTPNQVGSDVIKTGKAADTSEQVADDGIKSDTAADTAKQVASDVIKTGKAADTSEQVADDGIKSDTAADTAKQVASDVIKTGKAADTSEQVADDRIKSDTAADTAKQVASDVIKTGKAAETAEQVADDGIKSDTAADTAKQVASDVIKTGKAADTSEQVADDRIKSDTAADTAKQVASDVIKTGKAAETAEQVADDGIKPDTAADTAKQVASDVIKTGTAADTAKQVVSDVIKTGKAADTAEQVADYRIKSDTAADTAKQVASDRIKTGRAAENKLNDERNKEPSKKKDEKIKIGQLLVEEIDVLTDNINKIDLSTNKTEIAKEKDQDGLVTGFEKLSLKKDKLDKTKSDREFKKPENENRESSAEKKKSKDGYTKTGKDSDKKSTEEKHHGETVQKINERHKAYKVIIKSSERGPVNAEKKKTYKEKRFESCNIKDTRPKKDQASIIETTSANLKVLGTMLDTKDLNNYKKILQTPDQNNINKIELPKNGDFLNNNLLNYPYLSFIDSPQDGHDQHKGMDTEPVSPTQYEIDNTKKKNMGQIKKQRKELVAQLSIKCCKEKKTPGVWKAPKDVTNSQEMAPIICKSLKLSLETEAFGELEKIMRLISARALGVFDFTEDVEAKLYSLFIHIGQRVVGLRPDLFLGQQAAHLLEMAMLLCDHVPFFTEYILSSMRVAYNELKKNGITYKMPIFAEFDKESELIRRMTTLSTLKPGAFEKGDTLIHILARLGMADGLQEIFMDNSFLLFDINAKNTNDFTALHEAVMSNQNVDPATRLRVLHLLLVHGKADPTIQEAFGGETAPHMALYDYNMMLVFTSHLSVEERNAFAKIENRLRHSLTTAAKKLPHPNEDVVNFLDRCKSSKSKKQKEIHTKPNPSTSFSPQADMQIMITTNLPQTCGSTVLLQSPMNPQPPLTYNQSPPTYQQSPPTYQQSPPTYQQSPPTYQQSPPTYQEPSPTYQQPSPTYQEPPPTYQQSPPTYQQPPPTYHQSPPTYNNSPSMYNHSSPPPPSESSMDWDDFLRDIVSPFSESSIDLDDLNPWIQMTL